MPFDFGGGLSSYKKFDTSWFELSKYDFLKGANLADWEKFLSIRYELYSFICYGEKSDVEICETVFNFIEKIKNSPSYVKHLQDKNPFSDKPDFTHNPELPFNTYSVRSLSVFDAYLRGDFINCSRSALRACQINMGIISPRYDLYDDAEVVESKRFNSALLNKPIDFLIKDTERKTRTAFSSVTIDLEATDEQILKDFQYWLTEYRKAIKEYAPQKNFTDETLSDWVKWQLLPYIDLMIVAKYEGKKLHHHVAARLLFPDEFDVDTTERIRRKTKSKAEWLIQTETIRAIETQLANLAT